MPALFTVAVLVLPMPESLKEVLRKGLMKVLFHEVHVGVKMSLFRFLFVVSTVVLFCTSPAPRQRDPPPPRANTRPSILLRAHRPDELSVMRICLWWHAAVTFMDVRHTAALNSEARFGVNMDKLLGRKWRAERNFWISLFGFTCWVVVSRLNQLLRDLYQAHKQIAAAGVGAGGATSAPKSATDKKKD